MKTIAQGYERHDNSLVHLVSVLTINTPSGIFLIASFDKRNVEKGNLTARFLLFLLPSSTVSLHLFSFHVFV